MSSLSPLASRISPLNDITSDLIADGTITFTDWASSGCTSGQAPIYGGSSWSCRNIALKDAWSAKTPLTIGATTTAPSKATTKQNDFIRYRDVGGGEVEVDMLYSATSASGGSTGSGDYLFSLPTGLSFDLTEQPAYTGSLNLATSSAGGPYILRGSTGSATSSNQWWSHAQIVPYSATQFRIVTDYYTNGPTSGDNAIGSGVFNLTYPSLSIYARFTFVKQ